MFGRYFDDMDELNGQQTTKKEIKSEKTPMDEINKLKTRMNNSSDPLEKMILHDKIEKLFEKHYD